MNVRTILTNIVSFVTPKMHATRQKAVSDCVHSLANGSAATVTSIGRGINSGAYEKHSIKRADRLLSNPHLLREQSLIYGAICRLFCTAKHPTISIDWSDLDECKRHFLLRASLSFDGRAIALYEEVHPLSTKEKPAAHKLFLLRLSLLLPADCKPVIVTNAGFKTPWFRQIEALGWYFVGRVRKPCFLPPITVRTGSALANCMPKHRSGRSYIKLKLRGIRHLPVRLHCTNKKLKVVTHLMLMAALRHLRHRNLMREPIQTRG